MRSTVEGYKSRERSERLFIDDNLREFAVGKFKAAVREARHIITFVGRMLFAIR